MMEALQKVTMAFQLKEQQQKEQQQQQEEQHSQLDLSRAWDQKRFSSQTSSSSAERSLARVESNFKSKSQLKR